MARGHIMRQLYLRGNTLSQNVVFDHPSILQLANYLDALIRGSAMEEINELDVMVKIVEQFGTFEPFKPGIETPLGDVVLITGATGSLGSHILSQLLPLPHIRHVYCLVRAADPTAASERVISSLISHSLHDPSSNNHKFANLTALPSDFSHSDLGLTPETLSILTASLTTIIHTAWAVNFNLGVTSFVPHHGAGTRHLLNLSLSVPFPQPVRFIFISSVSAASDYPPPAIMPESFVADPAHAQGMGYARSKLVAEHLVRRAATDGGMGGRARVLRVGQLVGNATSRRWNAGEAIPLMIRSANTLGALPALEEWPSWLPVDVCARAVVELSGEAVPAQYLVKSSVDEDGSDVVNHVLNSRRFGWTEELLPALKEAGMDFETVSTREWIRQLREGDQDPARNPTVKLLEFFIGKYDHDHPKRKSLVFETDKTERRSRAIANRFNVIGSGLVARCVEQWRKDW